MTNKGAAQNFFEDFHLGQIFHCPVPRQLSSADRTAYIGYTGDRTPLFCDAKGLVHPLIVFHIVLGQTVRQISLNAQANLGYAEMLWEHPVHVGDEIHTTAEIVGLRETSNLKTGIAYVRTTGFNQNGHVLLTFTRWVLVRKAGTKETEFLKKPVIPELSATVAARHLAAAPHFNPDAKATGGSFFFEDYTRGERIDHLDGMTINNSDHMSFTRLFQNSARVHFDVMATGGRPLVYGGLPLSIGYAQSYAGLENRIGIRAINSGTHANPVYAGDTLYSFTEVLDCADLSENSGGLRLRLIVVKNRPAGEIKEASTKSAEAGKAQYQPDVVLDLDYWELMAKRGFSREKA